MNLEALEQMKNQIEAVQDNLDKGRRFQLSALAVELNGCLNHIEAAGFGLDDVRAVIDRGKEKAAPEERDGKSVANATKTSTNFTTLEAGLSSIGEALIDGAALELDKVQVVLNDLMNEQSGLPGECWTDFERSRHDACLQRVLIVADYVRAVAGAVDEAVQGLQSLEWGLRNE